MPPHGRLPDPYPPSLARWRGNVARPRAICPVRPPDGTVAAIASLCRTLGRLWNPPPSPKVRCPGGARCRRRFRAGRRRRGLKEAGRCIPENPAWTRPGLAAGPGFRASPDFRSGLGARVAPFRHRGTGRATRRRRTADRAARPQRSGRPTPSCPLSRAMRRCAGPSRLRERGEAQGHQPWGAAPGGHAPPRQSAVGTPAAPCARAPPDRGGGRRRMCCIRAVLPPSSGPPHPDPPPAAVFPARRGAEPTLR